MQASYLSHMRAMCTPSPAQRPAASGGTFLNNMGGCFTNRKSQKVTATETPTAMETEKWRGRYCRRIASRNTVRNPRKSEPSTKKRSRRATTAALSFLRRATGGASDVQDQARRILERFLDRDERQHRLAAIHDAMVVREGEVVHRPDDDLAVLDHGPLLGRV